MASIADLLGVQWNDANGGGGFRLNTHSAKQATMKGFAHEDVLAAANNPSHTYPNGRYPGQVRHVRNGLVAVVDPKRGEVVTVYKDQEKTALRADQKHPDAIRYAKSLKASVGPRR